MKQFQMTINHTEIKRNAIAKAKEVAGNDINKARELLIRLMILLSP